MFIGRYEHSIDSKNRMIIPVKYRDELGSSFIITQGLDGCLYILPMPVFVELTEKLKGLPVADKSSRAFLRYLVSNASMCDTDKQGRVILSVKQKEHAGIEKDTVILGMIDKIEVWSKEAYEKNLAETDIEEIENNLAASGLRI